jgi:hypothetical protein
VIVAHAVRAAVIRLRRPNGTRCPAVQNAPGLTKPSILPTTATISFSQQARLFQTTRARWMTRGRLPSPQNDIYRKSSAYNFAASRRPPPFGLVRLHGNAQRMASGVELARFPGTSGA